MTKDFSKQFAAKQTLDDCRHDSVLNSFSPLNTQDPFSRSDGSWVMTHLCSEGRRIQCNSYRWSDRCTDSNTHLKWRKEKCCVRKPQRNTTQQSVQTGRRRSKITSLLQLQVWLPKLCVLWNDHNERTNWVLFHRVLQPGWSIFR